MCLLTCLLTCLLVQLLVLSLVLLFVQLRAVVPGSAVFGVGQSPMRSLPGLVAMMTLPCF
jgi:hypothetical protein